MQNIPEKNIKVKENGNNRCKGEMLRKDEKESGGFPSFYPKNQYSAEYSTSKVSGEPEQVSGGCPPWVSTR